MEIEVNVNAPSLQSLIEEDYDGQETIGDRVVRQLVSTAVKGDNWKSFQKRVEEIRDSMIREAVATEIEAALSKPFTRTNQWGEPQGEETTLRQVLAEEAKRALSFARKGGYSYDVPEEFKPLHRVIQVEAANAVSALLKKEIAEETERIRESIRTQAAALVAGEKK
jgi:hypothetical protein